VVEECVRGAPEAAHGGVRVKATETKTEPKVETKCNPVQVKAGDVWSRHSFGRVLGRGFGPDGEMIRIENTNGKAWDIGVDLVAAEFSFANQHDVDITLSRTKALEVLTKRTWTAMTVKFRKKVDLKQAAEALNTERLSTTMNAKDWTKLVETIMAGEERTMVGYHHGDHDQHGRLVFWEIVEGREQRRLIDPRTVFEVIVAKTRYLVDE
jgi:hypothetical protein